MTKLLGVMMVILVASAALVLFASGRSVQADPSPSGPMLAHNVFFSLNDNSPQAIQHLIQECHTYLASEPGTIFYAAGTVSDIDRPVSDRDYDVALHVVFRDRAAHDAYQTTSKHLEFIARNKANWKKVRVFDSNVASAAK